MTQITKNWQYIMVSNFLQFYQFTCLVVFSSSLNYKTTVQRLLLLELELRIIFKLLNLNVQCFDILII